MSALIADYGYLSAEDRPETWGADGRIDTPLGILAFLE
jgi:phosphoglycolate phosphatase